MNMLVSTAIAGTAVPAAVAEAASGDDLKLTALAGQLVALLERQKEATAIHSKLYEEYQASAPERPAVLRWRLGDPAGPQETFDTASSKRWCHPFWIKQLRGVEQRRYWFVGTDEEARTIKGTEFAWGGRPDESIAHLYRSEPDPQLQKRADELLAAQDAFDAADEAAAEAAGYIAASEIFYRMSDLEASSLEGLRSLALAHVCLSEGKIESAGGLDDLMIGKLLSSLTGMPVSAPEPTSS
jgi:hypothetical protein